MTPYQKALRRMVWELEGPVMGRYHTLAERFGVSSRTVYRWLKGETHPSPEHRDLIENYMEVTG